MHSSTPIQKYTVSDVPSLAMLTLSHGWGWAFTTVESGVIGMAVGTVVRIVDGDNQEARTGELLWRTPYLVSNNVFIFAGDDVIVTGYGFTDETDYLFLVDAGSGEVTSQTRLVSGHSYLEIKDDRLYVFTYRRHCIYESPAR